MIIPTPFSSITAIFLIICIARAAASATSKNVGWCKPGTECRYNVFMMEETHTVLAAGAGAVTKLKKPGSNYIERIFNYKYPYEYNARFDTLMERKKRISEFYSEIFGSQSSADK